MSVSISGQTALVGVLGDPVRHSLSPAMHNAALRELGLDWIYLALPVAAADLAVAVRGLEALDCRGLNITLPHKQAVAALAAELTPLARRLGAVNTLIRREAGGWLGTNTDVAGFLAPLQQEPTGSRALVLGCGGSARAVVAGLVERGLERIELVGREPRRREAFVAGCRPWAPQLRGLPWNSADLLEALGRADLVVNTTPVGMASAGNRSEACPLDPQELEALQPGALVYDLIYTPRPTRLLQEARRRGCRGLDGLEMLIQQGAASLRLWSSAATGGAEIPVAAMRRAALEQLGQAL
ncbi:shikimate dehydrogenase [Synechococcus sp. CS-1324]|uniref:shikimate dehydrogenase n=1 Tax=unclassified Synechococcus TaxID=2626047 RepID=UPI000DB61844|nr:MULTISPECIES: shikimate dehydrogenase [unclassified Synechococcus]MCT0214621.1 shikimate dehydrogenase [Synechococcus sp. CS-1326]MCT0231198.1 shikimate dehydrogenase [Synechococcus sp. CS-1324]MCT0233955.1 shikimate dehydrogenase [Synechococcus sp. CS-1327]PZV05101.1 MAG: shikimate dehydrogenase [Cyanobium sp.]